MASISVLFRLSQGCLLQDIAGKCRGIAQSGSASGLGPEGREFESLYPDQLNQIPNPIPTRQHHNAPVAHLDRASAF